MGLVGRSITLTSATAVFGRVAVTYAVVPLGPDRSRLVARVVYPAGRHVLGRVVGAVLPPGELVMMRKQLLTLKALAERDAAGATR